jgi:hypothetical protein
MASAIPGFRSACQPKGLESMMTYRTIIQFLTVSLLAAAMGGCLLDSKKDSGTDTMSVQITTPAAAQIDTTDQTMSIAGTAISVSPISSVEWVSDRGSEGMANGTDNWQINNIPLELGSNDIMVTATDMDGQNVSSNIQINRESTGTGSVTLNWNAPSTRADGSPLTDLAGYRVYYGRMSEIYDFKVRIRNPGILTYVIENLAPGEWFFVTAAYDSAGVESDFSNEVSTTIL